MRVWIDGVVVRGGEDLNKTDALLVRIIYRDGEEMEAA